MHRHLDWLEEHRSAPKAGGDTEAERYLGRRRPALIAYLAKYGTDLNDLENEVVGA
jgi:hypothetical protein